MSEDKAKIAVIIPSLNSIKYIEECLQSVLNQTLKDLQIICVDAKSTDGTLEYLQEQAKKDKRIEIIVSEKKSYGYQMNLGVKAAKAEYLGIVESDDYIKPTMYEKLYKVARRERLDIVKANMLLFEDKNGERIFSTNLINWNQNLYYKVLGPCKELFTQINIMNPSGIFRLDFLREHNIWHNESAGAAYQDTGFWFQTNYFAKRIYFLNEAYYCYRQDNESSSVNFISFAKAMILSKEYDFIKEIAQKSGNLEYIKLLSYLRFGGYNWLLGRMQKKDVLEFLEQIKKEFTALYEKGEIDESIFDEFQLKRLKAILKDPKEFYKKTFKQQNSLITKSKRYLKKKFFKSKAHIYQDNSEVQTEEIDINFLKLLALKKEQKDKKVALIVPVFNVEKFLAQCLESLINQSYENLSIIVVNDGSEDSSLELAKAYAKKDERIVILSKDNGGQSSARNAALTYLAGGLSANFIANEEGLRRYEIKAKSESDEVLHIKEMFSLKESSEPERVDYIQFVDSDDFIDLYCVEECVKRMQNVDIVFIDTKPFYDGVKSKAPWASNLSWLDYKNEQILSRDDFLTRLAFKKQHFFYFAAAAGMFSFSYLQKIKLRFINGIVQEDDYFGILLFTQARYIYIFPKAMYHYRIRANSIMNYNKQISSKNIPIFFKHHLSAFDDDAKATKEYLHTSSFVRTALALLDFTQDCECAYTRAVIEKYLLPTYANKALEIIYSPKDPLNLIPELCELQPFFQKNKRGAKEKLMQGLEYQIGSHILKAKGFKGFCEALKNASKMIASSKKLEKLKEQRQKAFSFIRYTKLEDYEDFHEAKWVQNHLSYRLGKQIVRAYKNPFLKVFLPFMFVAQILAFKLAKAKKPARAKNPVLEELVGSNWHLNNSNWHLYNEVKHLQYLVFREGANKDFESLSLSHLRNLLDKNGIDIFYESIFLQMLKERKICLDFSADEGAFIALALSCGAFVYAYEGSAEKYDLLAKRYENEANLHLQNAYLCEQNSTHCMNLHSKNGLGVVPNAFCEKKANFIYLSKIAEILAKEERIYILKFELHFKNHAIFDELLQSGYLDKIDFVFLQVNEYFKESELYKDYEKKLKFLPNFILMGGGV